MLCCEGIGRVSARPNRRKGCATLAIVDTCKASPYPYTVYPCSRCLTGTPNWLIGRPYCGRRCASGLIRYHSSASISVTYELFHMHSAFCCCSCGVMQVCWSVLRPHPTFSLRCLLSIRHFRGSFAVLHLITTWVVHFGRRGRCHFLP